MNHPIPHGNPHVAAMKGAVCPRGNAGPALIRDKERPQAPMMRVGERGEGQWRTVSWNEALDYVAGELTNLTGLGRKDVVYDLKNARHVVLQLRNIFESINVQEVNNLMDALENGCKLTVIDIRANISATKAHNFMLIRPGTDYAFNLAVIHELINKNLYDKDYAYRHDPLMGFPEPERLKKMFANLDLMVSVTFSWSDTAWYSDVVLPLSPYLERESILVCKNGLKPHFFVRKRAVEPRFDTKADWEIISGLAKRMGLEQLVFESVEDLWCYQLEGTDVNIEDFSKTGMVMLTNTAKYRTLEELKFKTSSGKIEIISEKLEKHGIKSLEPYQSPEKPLEGHFRLTFGRCALHTQGHTVNNPMLFEQMPENVLWINTKEAERLGISDGNTVTVSQNGYSETIKAKVTDMIHPEAVFVIHGFGHTLPVESRAFMRGLADNKFMKNGLDIWDPVGGAVALQEHFVKVLKE